MTGEVLEAEKKSLPVHVEMCGQRYGEIHERLRRIERGAWTAAIAMVILVLEKVADKLF